MLKMLIDALKNVSDPSDRFGLHEIRGWWRFYGNYLEATLVYLDDGGLEVIEKMQDTFGIPDDLLAKLVLFRQKIFDFADDDHLAMSNFDLARCPEWDELMPLAQECRQGLLVVLKQYEIDHPD